MSHARRYADSAFNPSAANGNSGMALLDVRMSTVEAAEALGISKQLLHQQETIALIKLRAGLRSFYEAHFGKDYFYENTTNSDRGFYSDRAAG